MERLTIFPKTLHHRCMARFKVQGSNSNSTFKRALEGGWMSFIQYMRKSFRKINISYPLICTLMCAYQGVRYVSFSKNFVNVINGWSHICLW